MRAWLVPYLMCPRVLVLCLKEANFWAKFLTVKTKLLKKKKYIVEKCEVCSRGTFNNLFLVKKGITEMRVWVWLGII